MNNYLLIGKGFIGAKVQELLESKGHEVKVISRSTTGHDITKLEDMQRAMKGKSYTAVILMAAMADLNDFEKKPYEGMQVNVGGVVNVAQICYQEKLPLIYISTCCAYGNTLDLPSDEEARPNPSEIYAGAKLAGEWIIKGYNKSYDLPYMILRIATTYGPDMRKALAPAVFINQTLDGKPITIHGDGKQTRTLTYIDDEVEGIVEAILGGKWGETYNISSEEELSVRDWAMIISYEFNENQKFSGHATITLEKDRKGQTFVEQIDASKAFRDFGWKAKVSFEDGIKKTKQWMKDNKIERFTI